MAYSYSSPSVKISTLSINHQEHAIVLFHLVSKQQIEDLKRDFGITEYKDGEFFVVPKDFKIEMFKEQ